MKYNKLGNTDLSVSEIGFGVLTVGHNQLNLPIDEGGDLVKYALEKGINFLDTAEYYETYPYIKNAFEKTPIRPIICSKSLGSTKAEMNKAIDDGLKALDIAFFDIFLMHEIRHDGDWESRNLAFEALKEAKKAGKVKYIGISTHHVDVTIEVSKIPELDIIFPLINLEGLGIRNGATHGCREDMEHAISLNVEAGKGIFLMKVFGGGNLVARYQEALNYGQGIEGSSSMMIGFGSKDEVDKAIAFAEGTLPKEYTPNLSNKKITIEQGDCEQCFACLRKCPNDAIYVTSDSKVMINNENCLTCGYCAPVCPTRALIFIG